MDWISIQCNQVEMKYDGAKTSENAVKLLIEICKYPYVTSTKLSWLYRIEVFSFIDGLWKHNQSLDLPTWITKTDFQNSIYYKTCLWNPKIKNVLWKLHSEMVGILLFRIENELESCLVVDIVYIWLDFIYFPTQTPIKSTIEATVRKLDSIHMICICNIDNIALS